MSNHFETALPFYLAKAQKKTNRNWKRKNNLHYLSKNRWTTIFVPGLCRVLHINRKELPASPLIPSQTSSLPKWTPEWHQSLPALFNWWCWNPEGLLNANPFASSWYPWKEGPCVEVLMFLVVTTPYHHLGLLTSAIGHFKEKEPLKWPATKFQLLPGSFAEKTYSKTYSEHYNLTRVFLVFTFFLWLHRKTIHSTIYKPKTW